jgi:hypothetical protein
MINPARRLLFELLVLPWLRGAQAVIDWCTAVLRRAHLIAAPKPVPARSAGGPAKYVVMIAGLALLTAVPARSQGTPPYFPSGGASGGPSQGMTPPGRGADQKMPPDTKAPAHSKLSTKEVEQQIQNKLDDEPQLEGASVLVAVDDKTVTVSGSIADEKQREVVRRIVTSYSGNRKIVDKLTLAEKRTQAASF